MRRLHALIVAVIAATVILGGGSLCAQESDRIAWGPRGGNGLRVGIADARHTAGTERSVEVWFQNAGDSDFIVNLGVMLANGKVMEPMAVSLKVTTIAGATTVYRWGGPMRVGGRLDDYIVSLRAGSTHMLLMPLSGFRRVASISPFRLAAEPLGLDSGAYRISASFEGEPARALNSDTPGIQTFNFWRGSVESGALGLTIGQ